MLLGPSCLQTVGFCCALSPHARAAFLSRPWVLRLSPRCHQEAESRLPLPGCQCQAPTSPALPALTPPFSAKWRRQLVPSTPLVPRAHTPQIFIPHVGFAKNLCVQNPNPERFLGCFPLSPATPRTGCKQGPGWLPVQRAEMGPNTWRKKHPWTLLAAARGQCVMAMSADGTGPCDLACNGWGQLCKSDAVWAVAGPSGSFTVRARDK